VANRFVRKIKSGEIESIEELKSEFKEIAKLTHPDLLGQDSREGSGNEFAAARSEYEAALRDFEKHRFGARERRGDAARGRGAAGPMPDAAWASLALLLKRGFPKTPRHEKEALRYEYAVWRLAEALGPEGRLSFSAFESDLLDMKAGLSPFLDPAMELVADLIEYRERGLAAMRTQIVLSLGSLRAEPGVGTGFRRFAEAMAAELWIGGEIA